MRTNSSPSKELQIKLRSLPTSYGIYKFLNETGKILYIGKAINLKSRVGSYFTSDHNDRPWIRQMIPLIADVEVIRTENDVESLILESNLIKKHKPKYNAGLKDDKRYAWIVIDTRSPFPSIAKTRELNMKGRYFGPYPDGRAVNQVLKYIRKIYPYRDCTLEMFPDRETDEVKKSRLCIYYHLNLCTGPCDNLVSKQSYRKSINEIIKTLQGKKKSHITQLRKKMGEYAQNERFEKAAQLRDKIQDLTYLSQRIDVQYGDAEDEFKEIQQSRYLDGIREIIKHLSINIPEHKLKSTRIECYDVSNISGEITYGSMVVSVGTSIKPSQYRIFKIREEKKSNDPEMLKRVLQRRLKYLVADGTQHTHDLKKNRNESLFDRPHIILLDGAQPQLSAVKDIVPKSIGLLGISKGKHLKRAGDLQEDEFWKIDETGKFRKISFENPFLLQRLRDEAHRFAIKHHRKGRRYEQKKSVLDTIPEIGPKRKRKLMKHFKTVDKIAAASEKELNKVLNNTSAAKQIADFFKKNSHTKTTTKGSPPRN